MEQEERFFIPVAYDQQGQKRILSGFARVLAARALRKSYTATTQRNLIMEIFQKLVNPRNTLGQAVEGYDLLSNSINSGYQNPSLVIEDELALLMFSSNIIVSEEEEVMRPLIIGIANDSTKENMEFEVTTQLCGLFLLLRQDDYVYVFEQDTGEIMEGEVSYTIFPYASELVQ